MPSLSLDTDQVGVKSRRVGALDIVGLIPLILAVPAFGFGTFILVFAYLNRYMTTTGEEDPLGYFTQTLIVSLLLLPLPVISVVLISISTAARGWSAMRIVVFIVGMVFSLVAGSVVVPVLHSSTGPAQARWRQMAKPATAAETATTEAEQTATLKSVLAAVTEVVGVTPRRNDVYSGSCTLSNFSTGVSVSTDDTPFNLPLNTKAKPTLEAMAAALRTLGIGVHIRLDSPVSGELEIRSHGTPDDGSYIELSRSPTDHNQPILSVNLFGSCVVGKP